MRRRRILFVDNHALFARTVTERFLAEHEVAIVATVAEAKASLSATAYDVVLLDYDVDDQKGDALVRWARAVGQRLPIIAVSAHDDGNQALVRAGATAACAKTRFANIGDVLAEAVGQRRAIAASAVVLGARADGSGDDRAEILERDDGLLVAVIDGVGGSARASAAADAALVVIRQSCADLVEAVDATALLASIDRQLAAVVAGGQVAAVVATVTAAGVRGASADDCGAWLVGADGYSDLTEGQVKKPFLGSGQARVLPFAARLDGTLLLASDGLWKYAPPAGICAAARYPDREGVPRALAALVRLRSGRLPDDLAVIACRAAGAAAAFAE